MIYLRNLRASGALWTAVPAAVYLILLVSGSDTMPGLGIAMPELALWAVLPASAASAACAAWEAGRHRALAQLNTTSARGPAARALMASSPAATVVAVLAVLALGTAALQVDAIPGHLEGGYPIAHIFILPALWAAIGWAAGSLVPRAIAAPASAIAAWVLIAMPGGMEDPHWRHLTGMIFTRSSWTHTLTPDAYLVPWMVTAAIAACALIATLRRTGLTIAAFAAAIGVIVVAHGIVTPWGYDSPTTPIAATACSGGKPEICVPRDASGSTDLLHEQASPYLAALRTAGVTTPERLAVQDPRLPLAPGTWLFPWSPGNDPARLPAQIAEAAVRAHHNRPCPASTAAVLWALKTMHAPVPSYVNFQDPQGAKEADAALALPKDRQAAWFATTAGRCA